MSCALHPLGFTLHFEPLAGGVSSLAWGFPCDGEGQVDIDALSEQSRKRYLYARAVTGIQFAAPVVRGASQP
jgi:hypothetical protein